MNHNINKLEDFPALQAQAMFSIIKDNKAKDKVGVGDKAPTPKFLQFDQVWSNLIKFDPIWSNLNQFDLVLTK